MPVRVEGAEGNTLDASDLFLAHQNGVIRFTGKGGCFSVGELTRAADINITIGDRCSVDIGQDCHLSILTIYTTRSSKVTIGDGVAFTWDCQISCHESFNVSIGQGCLIAPKTLISVSDMHTIYDRSTKRRINHGKSIAIAARVWVGAGASILKGVSVGEGAIIGTGSIVTKSLPAYSASAGVPAKVVRRNVGWHHSLEWETETLSPEILPKSRWVPFASIFRAIFPYRLA